MRDRTFVVFRGCVALVTVVLQVAVFVVIAHFILKYW